MKMSTPDVRLLWTGGWESTFRLLTLVCRQKCAVQPYYVIDRERASWPVELKAMMRIERHCYDRPGLLKGRILPKIVVEKDAIPQDYTISRQFHHLRSRVYIGGQYEWLACLAKSLGTQLELCADTNPEAQKTIGGGSHWSSLVRRELERKNGPVTATHVLKENAPLDLQFFRWFEFPTIDMSKTDILRTARAFGFYDVMKLTHFCFTPLQGNRPCGTCNPCRYAMHSGMDWRVGWRGKLRYYLHPVYSLMPSGMRQVARSLSRGLESNI